MKRTLFIYSVIIGFVFYNLNSNSDLLQEYFSVARNVVLDVNAISEENVKFAVNQNKNTHEIACVKIHGCYYCKPSHQKIKI